MFILTFKRRKKSGYRVKTHGLSQKSRASGILELPYALEYGEGYDWWHCTLQHFTRKKTGLSYALLSVFNKLLGSICDLYLAKEGKKTQLKNKVYCQLDQWIKNKFH